MKKILIVINSNLFLRNYISTGAFKLLEEKYEVHFIYEKSIIKKVGIIIIFEPNNFVNLDIRSLFLVFSK